MFENISYKKKFFALLALMVVLGITAYKRSFIMTLDASQLLEESKVKLEKVSNSQQRITNLIAEVSYLDKLIGKEVANPDIVQQEILNTFTDIKSETKLVKLESIHKASDEYFNIYTNRLILTGDYGDLLKTTYNYEKFFDFSRVVSLRFYIEKEPRTRREKLFEQIIFQNYEKIR
ncbi:hypothetical protein SAMN04487910_0198 [Aquimarina amphilecti]|uniref:Uncharacterized protein n=1 Tax=Aquimarina amphilecti TaxID=1038014 RepID=A0A1H7FVQ3_AQUAM|nr:hypothetical protein [Aquimarina amphilecti]SEK30153.1 hypothetical protein SAMN04487910_0198 [Aquimarina amphilecti]